MRLVAAAAFVLALLLGGVSLLANIFYGLQITAGTERWLYAVAGGIGDALKLAVPVLLGWLIHTKRTSGRSGTVVCGLFFVVFASLWSIICATGLYEIIRVEKIGSTNAIKENHRILTARQAELRSDLERYRASVPMETVQASIRAMEQDRLFGRYRTKGCTDATAPESIAFCKEWEKLRGQAAVAIPAADRQAKITAAEEALGATRTRLTGISLATVLSATDPATKGFARITGLDEGVIRGWLALAFAFLIEAAGVVVPFIARQAFDEAPEVATDPVAEEINKEAIELTETDSPVASWLRGHVTRRRGCEVGAREMFEAFERWRVVHGETPINQRQFGAELTRLGISKKKSGKVRYVDVSLIPEAKPELRLVSA